MLHLMIFFKLNFFFLISGNLDAISPNIANLLDDLFFCSSCEKPANKLNNQVRQEI